MNWAAPIGAVAIVSLLSLVGLLTLTIRPNTLKSGLLILISFAAGALLGDAFLHLLPEVVEEKGGFPVSSSMGLLGGVIAFFVLEKVLHWHHSHIAAEEVLHPVAVTNLVGDALHNFVDGAIVAGAFLTSSKLGIATTIAVALHEIPQEVGDFGILLHAGLKPRRALLLNFLTALAAILGAIVTLVTASFVQGLETALLPITAGGFVYIASTDLIPELHKEPEAGKSTLQLAALLTGVAVMGSLLLLE
jgi:zinc and cadmium transporter